jgi:isoleucyl-tRNA synthetase
MGCVMYRQYDEGFNFPKLENSILEYWESKDIFKKSLRLRQNAPRYVFYEGPPTANGLPHAGHALARTIKDCACRYQSMKGYLVERKAGWDTHGLPVELDVEKQLGLESKEQIEKYGIENFNQKCKESVFRFKSEWDEFTRKLGYWIDLEHPYITYTNDYIETVWWILKKFHDAGLLYRGHKIVPWCPRCGTALSSHEVAQGYQDITEPSIYVKIRLKDKPDTFFLVWTTTPWTLLSNVAVAMAADETYVTVKHNNEKLILARARLGVLIGDYEIIEEHPGSYYEKTKYEPLFPYMADEVVDACYATLGDFVTMEDGTGIVHIAPAFGEDDFELGRKYNLPVVQAVDTKGSFINKVTPWAGLFVKQADPEINKELNNRKLLYKTENYTHSYPFCWRCDTPLLYYARSSWYVKTTAFKDKMIEANKAIQWYPPEIGSGRFGEWLENNVDWALSRERYWGTPLPIWICQGCGKETAIGSIEQLKKEAVNFPDNLDLHRPFVDAIELKCSSCGQAMNRVKEVIDAWFDSGSMPYGQVHYPFENKDEFEIKYFPGEFIAEGLDQTRGWFYSMLAISVFVSGRSSYKRCVVNNLVLDLEGKKMSKHIGNVVDPKMILNKYGADVLRWYLMNSSQLWLPKRFDENGVVEVLRKYFSTLQNSFSFFALYADIDRFDPSWQRPAELPILDRWLISRLNGLIINCAEAYDNFDYTRVTRHLTNFVIDELSNWWIKRSRKRFWGAQMSDDKLTAYSVLYESLLTTCKLMAPVSPFMAEDIYLRLTEHIKGSPESVHHCDFPVADKNKIDKNLDYIMAQAENIVSLGRAARKDANVKIRQPLARMIVINETGKPPAGLDKLYHIILEELNIKNIEFTSDGQKYVSLKAQPIFKEIGPKFGPLAPKIAEAIKNMTDKQTAAFQADGEIKLMIDGFEKMLTQNEIALKVSPATGYAAAADSKLKVAIDLALDEQLLAEGFARELVNKIQNMRKSAGLEVVDRIKLGISKSPEADKALALFEDYLKNETLAVEITNDTNKETKQTWDINGVQTEIAITKAG